MASELLDAVNATVNSTGITNSSLNTTINSTINTTIGTLAKTTSIIYSFLPLVFVRLWALITAPFLHGEMLWIIFPLFFTLFVMEFYYDKNNDEELGWGAAIVNSLLLIIVTIDLIKVAFHGATPWEVLKQVVLAIFTSSTLPIAPQVILLIIFLGALGIAVTLINYFHLLPRMIAFEVSSHPPMNFLAYFAIVIVYTAGTPYEIPFDLATLTAAVLLFVLILVVVFWLKRLKRRLTGEDDTRRGFGKSSSDSNLKKGWRI